MRIYPLLDFLDNDKKEQSIQRLINEFSCPKNPDVERFLKNKAIDFERTHNARTYLLVSENGELLAYFSLSFKDVNIDNEKLSKSVIKIGLIVRTPAPHIVKIFRGVCPTS